MDYYTSGPPGKADEGDESGNGLTRGRRGNGDQEKASMTREASSVASRAEADAVVFSIQFYGKTIGEVGLMDQDLSQLDWKKFKSYIFQNLLSMNHQENICVSYSDDEGDKLPIESEEEYREALKVAKKKAEAHDKLVLDITRQGGLPTMLSFVSSGIRRVSSSPPKEGGISGISFFKASSPPKESSGFMTRTSGTDRRVLPTLFSTDRGAGEGEVTGGGARPKINHEWKNSDEPPAWFTSYMNKFHEELCEEVVTKLMHQLKKENFSSVNMDELQDRFSQVCMSNTAKTAIQAPFHTQQSSKIIFPQADRNLSRSLSSIASHNPTKGHDPTRSHNSVGGHDPTRGHNPLGGPDTTRVPNPLGEHNLTRGHDVIRDCDTTGGHGPVVDGVPMRVHDDPIRGHDPTRVHDPMIGHTPISHDRTRVNNSTVDGDSKDHYRTRSRYDPERSNPFGGYLYHSTIPQHKIKVRDKTVDIENHATTQTEAEKKVTQAKSSDSGVKRKKCEGKVEEVNKWLDKHEEEMAKKQGKLEEMLSRRQSKIEERFSKKHEKLEEKLVKKQEKLVERFQKQQEKVEKRRLPTKHVDETEKTTRTQEKVLAKMEGLRKKQTCTQEELNKLRKVVDKRHRAASTDQRQQRRHVDETEKTTRTQEKVLAKMEGLRKKQTCTQEELNKLRKVVDKHHRSATADQRQQRRCERKAGSWKAGRARRISIDNKAFPVDAALLHTALQELEALAEESPSEAHASITQGYDALYMRDITYPDGSEVAPGEEFVKTWRVMNSGVLSWNEKTVLCKWTQVRFQGSPVGWKLNPREKKVVCPPLEPGQEGDISVQFIAPGEPGWYATHWRFCQRGRVFGNQMWCAVHVSSKTNSEEHQACAQEEEEECSVPPSLERQSSLPEEDAQELLDTSKDSTVKAAPVCTVTDLITDCVPKEQPSIQQEEEPEAEEEEEEVLTTECEIGIIENYYDAEDPVREAKTQQDMTQHLSEVGQNTAEADPILISFEQEAEMVSSRPVSPEAQQSTSRTISVVPLKDMAKESLDSLRDSSASKGESKSVEQLPESCSTDNFSISSGSFSDLDSEDQAILNESDTDLSDQDYYVVNLPECFDLSHPYSSASQVSANNNPELERPDSPDFLTADEDDRTTSAAYNCAGNQDECVSGDSSAAEGNKATSNTLYEHPQHVDLDTKGPQPVRTESVGPMRIEDVDPQHVGVKNEEPKPSGDQNQEPQPAKSTGSGMSLPLPPTETKAFMDIPPEALRTNLAYSLYRESLARPKPSEARGEQQQQETGRATWGSSGAEERQQVVCEQPVSAQGQSKPSPASGAEGGDGVLGRLASDSQDPPTSADLAAALPEELVSIIPEDLVRGVWNTARTFISRINQEMLSPSASGPGRDSEPDGTEKKSSSSPASSQQELHQQEERRQEAIGTATPEQVEQQQLQPSLPPPLQQLADMGFSNHEVNQHLLTKYNNDVACAVAELIVLNCQ